MALVGSESVEGLRDEGYARSKVMEIARAYLILTKPRIAVLLLFTAYCAMIVAQGGLPDIEETFVGLLGLRLSAGGAAAINMWYDRDIDVVMSRTAHRPIPSGIVKPAHALWFGISLGAASIVVLLIFANVLAAALSAAGYLYYAVVYTMLLKRRTPQNIVIGGGAGAFPPLVGWATVTGHISVAAILMFAVIFLWTPSHFWGLALYKNDDYTRAGVPMMPVVKGKRTTKRQMVTYAVLLLISSLTLSGSMNAPLLYGVVSVVLGGWFLYVNARLLVARDDMVWAKKTFFSSLLYLPAIFTAMVVCTLM